MPTPIPFQKKIKVENDVIDHFNHVNNLAYIKWVLEISKEHWDTITPKSVRDEYGWMIMKHELVYKNQAKHNDKLIIKTWIDEYSTATCVRKTTILDAQTEILFFESKAQWCYVNLNSRKPSRLPIDIVKPYFEDL